MNWRIAPAGDSAVLVEFDERIDVRINEQVVRMARSVEAAGLAGVRDVVPTYRSVAVYFDPLRTDYDALIELLQREAGPAEGPAEARNGCSRIEDRLVRVPVCYGGDFGPDLAAIARHAGVTEAEVIARHTAPRYRVFMMGFLPGFTYLGTVHPSIAVGRHPTPRVRVPAGSVGIAGRQTGIYPLDTPGGWQLVGRTPVRMFDIERADPFLAKPGDAVQFYAIDAAEYARATAA
jgi:KipI family sensor histidine kinase inhibitor